ncbi:hypothetical protein GCM10022403_019070 [Streptomyces coacervatus]|uniref:Small hydrophobic protein n=1 Tax=Streptomyces coacervatus TaxID=647381 RepID=A0ABP7HCI6_9ACTN|nr:DUF6126 family protein [Streptomyces coacervatus]MDF2267387.1 DUF6126 family protein [Streptomyces coacervatus]
MVDQAANEPAGGKSERKVKDREWRIERGVAIRAGFYIFGTHLFAGFVWLLFYLGEHAHK